MNIQSAKKRKAEKNVEETASKNQGNSLEKKRKLNNNAPHKIKEKPISNQESTSKQTKSFSKSDRKVQKQAEKSKKFQKKQDFNTQNSKYKSEASKEEKDKKPENADDLDFNTEDGKNVILITKMNKLAMKLFDKKKESGAEKQKIIEKILGKITGLLPKLINKRSASKFIQACYKFGTVDQRKKIFDSFKNTDLAELFKSKYGHFLLVKMMKKGTKEEKNKLFDEIVKNSWFFVSHKEAGQVMDAFLKDAATPQQLGKIKNIFKFDENQKSERFENAAMRIIEKNLTDYQLSQYILSKVLKILIPNEREKVLEKFKENILHLGKTKEGVSLALEIINYSSNKQKKAMLKSLKGKVIESIKENDKKFLIVLKLLGEVDDKEVLNKYLVKEIISNFDVLLQNHNGINLISSLMNPKHNFLNLLEKNHFTNCKKDETTRREEIISLLLPHLIASLETDLSEHLREISLSRVISTVLIKITSDDSLFEEHSSFVEKTFECFEGEMDNGFTSTDPEEINKKYLTTHPDANRVLKCMIRIMNETKCEAAKSFLEGKIEKIYQFISKNLVLYLKTRLIFLAIALIENTSYKDALVQNIQKIKSKIPENVQGFKILKQLI